MRYGYLLDKGLDITSGKNLTGLFPTARARNARSGKLSLVNAAASDIGRLLLTLANFLRIQLGT